MTVSQDYSFRKDRLESIASMDRWHFWFVGRRLLVGRLMSRYLTNDHRMLLDVGCGTGRIIEWMSRQGFRTVGLDLRPEGLQSIRSSSADAHLVQASALELPLQPATFDVAMMMDVLEHVDDHRALREMRRILRPNGLLVLNVPAMPWLWSYRDDDAGHLRRYTFKTLTAVLAEEGFTVRELRYYQFLLFPLVAFTRIFGRRTPGLRDREEHPPASLNAFFIFLNKIEIALGDWLTLPWGSSIVAICERK